MTLNKKELAIYKDLTKEQVEFYQAMVATRMQVLLVRVCIWVIFILLGFGIYFFFIENWQAGAGCFATDTAFGFLGHKVYTHYFPNKKT